MPLEKLRKCPAEPPREIAAPLPPALEDAGNHPQIAACRKNVALCPAREPRHLAEGIGDERLVKLRRSARPESGDQPGLGFSGLDGAGKDGHGRGPAMLVPPRRERNARATRARCAGLFSSAFMRAGRAWRPLRAG